MTALSPAASLPALEKIALERYVAPAQPSLVGLTRAELAEALGRADVPERERKMRVQQLWHWIYFRGARTFDEMLNSEQLRIPLIVGSRTYAIGALTILGAAAASGYVVWRRLDKMDIIEVLKTRE